MGLRRSAQWWLLAATLLGLASGPARAQAGGAEALRAQFATLQEHATGRIVDRALYLQSTESSNRLQGSIHALVDQRYDDLRRALTRTDAWCGILILHLNVKYCRATPRTAADELVAAMGRKIDQPLADAHWLRFTHRVISADDGYLQVSLRAPGGPMGTTDYRIVVEAVPHGERQSLVHLAFGYGYGLTARLAMQAYLGSFARDKVGFSIVGRRADGQPVHVDGLRGVLERNTMRYYLALESYLGAATMPAAQRERQSLQDWFAGTERYPRQLHEVEREVYLAMKMRELRRQETEPPPQASD
jgi:hypothetical protein